jgi:2-alkyl-3-oxoalkanoate reductase
MKVFVAGATGVLGRQLVPMLVDRGHEVIGMTRTDGKRDLLRSLGARPVVADALDAEAVAAAVGEAEPEVIVHELTAIPPTANPRRLDRDFALTNRLRTEGTDHLLSAARAAGTRRFIAQSFAGWPFARSGGPVKTEEDPLDPDPPGAMRPVLDAIRHLERAVTEATWIEGIVLRYGGFYGPGTTLQIDPPGEYIEMIRKRRFPIIGNGGGVWSFIHIEDAAAATAIAVERGHPGLYNIVDDDPVRVSEWLPAAAASLGAKPPFRLPRWIGRLIAGEPVVAMVTEARGASNEKAKRELGWQPRHPSFREAVAGGRA